MKRALVGLLFVFGLLGGCNCGGTVGRTFSDLEADPMSLDFGDRVQGTSSVLSLTLSNAGSAAVDVHSAEVQGPDATAFGLVGLVPQRLAAGESTPLQVSFRPSRAGAFAARLVIVSNAANTVELSIPLVATASGLDAGPGVEDAGALDAGFDAGPGVVDAGAPDAGFDAGPGVVDAGPGAFDAGPGAPLPAVPLHTSGRWIVDAQNHRIKLASVNWYGAEERDYVVAGLELADRRTIARKVREMGFNSVRIPWSNEMLESNPLVADAVLAANPDLRGLHALEVLDAVIAALAHEGLMVILDNHVSRADWCCTDTDGQGLWYTAGYPESKWLADWRTIVARYAAQPAVIAADLRNEPRPVLDPSCTTCTKCPCATCTCSTPVWGGTDPALDWAAAAQRGGNAVLAVNPSLLIVVQGTDYSTNFSGPYTHPLVLNTPDRLVYSPHDYSWFHANVATYAALKTDLGNAWGYLLVSGQPYTAPVYVSEFGTCHTAQTCVSDVTGQGFWFSGFRTYLAEADIDWAYWALNGTQANAPGRVWGAEETYGVLDPSWKTPSLAALLDSLRVLQPATQGP